MRLSVLLSATAFLAFATGAPAQDRPPPLFDDAESGDESAPDTLWGGSWPRVGPSMAAWV